MDTAGKRSSVIGVVTADGGEPRILIEKEGMTLRQPRWSPDGESIVVTSDPMMGTDGGHLVLNVKTRRLEPVLATAGSTVSAASWCADGSLVFARAENSTPFVLNANRASELLLVMPGSSKKPRTLAWLPSFGFTSDVLADGKIVLEARVVRGNLQEMGLASGQVTAARRWFTHGPGTDRQPVYSPDGTSIVFASNRTGNWELWRLLRSDGSLKNLSENKADEWDPAFVGTGDRLVWSSNRTGHFEVWLSNADGSSLKKVSDDGVDAQNPSPTPDGKHIIYSSTNPRRLGLWRVDLATGKEEPLVLGRAFLPEVSPDGRFAAYMTGGAGERTVLKFIRLPTGEPLPLVIEAGTGLRPGLGRSRWMPDGKGIAFTATDPSGALSILWASFDEGAKVPAQSGILLVPEPGHGIETFGISRDGQSLTAELMEPVSSLALAEGVSGVEVPVRIKK
jgi:Tol biopolymer transport system component